MTKRISSNHFIPYLCNMKKHLTFKSRQLSTIFWLLIAGTFWIQFLNMSTSICEATLLTICITNRYIPCIQHLHRGRREPSFQLYPLATGYIGYQSRLLWPVLLFRKPAIRKREISIPLPDITAANHPSLHVQCAESHQYPDAG